MPQAHLSFSHFLLYLAQFMDLSLPIPKGGSSSSTAGMSGMSSALSRMSMFSSSSSGPSKCSINDCFTEFCKEELLCGNEQVYCRKCKSGEG